MKKIITLLTIVSSILFLSLPVSALDQKKEIIKLEVVGGKNENRSYSSKFASDQKSNNL